MTSTNPSAGEQLEGVLLVAILLVIGSAAAAAFTHIHDWTTANSPEGTGDWFGWANAVISDLVSLGVGLEVRRRRRHNLKSALGGTVCCTAWSGPERRGHPTGRPRCRANVEKQRAALGHRHAEKSPTTSGGGA